MGCAIAGTKKKVLFVTMSPEYGGTEKHLLDLLQVMSESGLELSVLCLDADQYSDRLKQHNTMHVRVRCERNLTSIRSWLTILRQIRPDIVVFVRSWVWCFPWYTCLGAWLAGIPRRFSIVHLPPAPQPRANGWSRASMVSLFRRLRKILGMKRMAIGCTSMICVSNAIRNSFVNDYRFPSKKIVTIHNGVWLSLFDPENNNRQTLRSKLGVGTEEFLLVCLAKLTSQKRIDLLLAAMEKLARTGLRCKCWIVGDGPLKEELVQQTRTSGLSGSVVFLGFQNDVHPYLRAADAFVLTSDFEGFPLSILEAMACGLPCIVTDVGGNAEAVTNGVHGFVVGPGSSDAVAQAVASLMENRHECARMARMAQTKVREEFDIRKRMAEVEDLILS
jgi:glycosyltransferase involved in cell wall biosynthesis